MNDSRDILARSKAAADLDLSDLSVGQVFSTEHCFDSASIDAYALLAGDFSPLHVDETYAMSLGFGGRVVHGMLLASLFSRLVGMIIPGRKALYLGQDLSFRRTVLAGEPVVATAKITAINPALGVIQLATTILKSDQSVAVSGVGKVRIRGSIPAATKVETTEQVRKVDGQRVALVTGASRGIGSAIAKRLATDGFLVAVNYRSNQEAAQRVIEHISRQGGQAVAMCADVRDDDAIHSMIAQIIERFGRLDLLVNNAAASYEMKSVFEVTWSDITEQLEASVRAPLTLCRATFPYLRESGGGIINIVSQVIENQPPARMLDYVLGKFGLLGLTRSLAMEWAAEGVRVNGVAPSLIETELTSHFKDRVFKMEASRTPLRRLATPDDVAAVVSFLAGSGASFLTGVVVPVTGGQVVK